MIIFQWRITLLCKKPHFLRADLVIPSKPLYYTAETCLVSLRQAGSKTTCLTTPIAFYRASLTLMVFVTLPIHSANIPNLLSPVRFSSFTRFGTCKMSTIMIYCNCVSNPETAQKTTGIAVFRRQSESLNNYIFSSYCCFSLRWEMMH